MEPKKIIFDTDLGLDCDDVIALDLLLSAAKAGECDLIGVTYSYLCRDACGCIYEILRQHGFESVPMGRLPITLELRKKSDGALLASESVMFERTAKRPDRKCWVDRKNRLIVDGKPFFPLGCYVYNVDAKILDTYMQGAFNCLMAYPYLSRATYDLIAARGLGIIATLKDFMPNGQHAPKKYLTHDDADRAFISRLEAFKDHPGIIAWYLNDEMPLSDLPRLTARRALVERLDPGHPGWSVQYQHSQIREYMPSFDVVGTDPYPVGETSVRKVTIWTRETAAGTMGCKPYWQVPQAFDVGLYKKDPKERARYRAPTEEELRNMCWQFIANGANGLILYSYFDLSKPTVKEPFEKKWAECCKVGSEIRAFFPVLLSDEKADTPPVKLLRDAEKIGEDVSVRSWWKGGEAWVLLVNAGDQPVRANVQLDGRFTTIRSAFSSGGELVRDDEISVPLAPLGVSFVRLAP